MSQTSRRSSGIGILTLGSRYVCRCTFESTGNTRIHYNITLTTTTVYENNKPIRKILCYKQEEDPQEEHIATLVFRQHSLGSTIQEMWTYKDWSRPWNTEVNVV